MRHDRKTRRRVAVACLAAGAAVLAVATVPVSAQAATGAILGSAQPVAGSYIVVLKDATAGAPATNGAAFDLARQYGGKVKLTYTSSIRGFAVQLDEAGAKRLAANPAVAYVQQDGVARMTDTQPNATWGLDRVDQRAMPLDSNYTYPNTASNVNAYILDTGVHKQHAEFEGRAKDGYDFIDNDGDASDCQGHGTHVAGTVGAKTYGVAKKVNLISVRVLDCQGSGQFSQIIAGVDWVAKNAVKPAVANMSLGGGGDTATDNAVKKAIQAGVTFVVASGNSNTDACGTSPARVPEAITVNATDNQDNRSSFSNYGSCTDIFAPGTNITSTKNGGGTHQLSGTSMATPHTVGAAAMYLSANTAATPAQVRNALVDNGTKNVVTSPGSGSTNSLLYVGFIGGDPEPPTCAGGTNGDDVSIPDNATAVSSSVSVTNCTGKASTATKVKVDINHTYTGDLVIDLVGPSGAVYNVKKARGASSAAGVHETFTVDASAENRNGTWKLQVTDVLSYDVGTIDTWTISF
ncbi:S8 family serine peptidase [Actinokineospora sp.]|uniref:S8 family serine peptidase n=1 Tax=Actinokineospora sp. TaxID=1872133 RepID=UPI004037D1B3